MELFSDGMRVAVLFQAIYILLARVYGIMLFLNKEGPMTIGIGAVCNNGKAIILTSDAMVTHGGLSIQFEHYSRKMTELSDHCWALTAGDALAHTELFNMVLGEIHKLKSPSVLEIVDKIKECYQIIRMKEIVEKHLKPKGFQGIQEFYQAQRYLLPEITITIQNKIDTYDYGLQILIGGFSQGSSDLYYIDNPGVSSCFDSIGFHAIGSGTPHALNCLIARNCHQGLSLEESILMVYEAKKMAEKAPGVGSNMTDMIIIDSNGAKKFKREHFNCLDTIHKKWVVNKNGWKTEVQTWIKANGG
jgi:hypothetical protein